MEEEEGEVDVRFGLKRRQGGRVHLVLPRSKRHPLNWNKLITVEIHIVHMGSLDQHEVSM